MPQPPDVGLAPGEARAVDARLLARAEADERAVLCVRDAVGLGVLERERREDEVRQRVRGKLGEVKSEGDEHSNEGRTYLRALGNDVVEEGGIDLCVVPALLEMHTVHLLGLDLAWDVSWVNLGRVSKERWYFRTSVPRERSTCRPSSSKERRAPLESIPERLSHPTPRAR